MPQIATALRVVGFDQRGTGALRPAALPGARARRAAAQRLGGRGRARSRLGDARRHYGTPDSVEDLEAIRGGSASSGITLFGISYGTELALAYARAHPDRVDRMILDSVVDPDDRDPFGLAGFRAMGPSAAPRCARRGAGAISANPAGDLAALTARLRVKPMRGVAYDRRGRYHRVRSPRRRSADLLFDADYNPRCPPGLPAAVNAALAGDAAPMARLAAEGDGLAELPAPRSFSSARYATVCEETPLPWAVTTPIADRAARGPPARGRRSAPAAFAPFDLDDRRRGRDRALPALAERALRARVPAPGRALSRRCRR